jgi:hypothetical protein
MLIIIVVLSLLTAAGFAADKNTGKSSQKSPTASESKETRSKSTKSKKTPEWPRPYKSTEKISVDSIVPFPTDI